jgi:pilus assembly protein CpaB
MFLIALLTAGVAVWMASQLIQPPAPPGKQEVTKEPEKTTQVVIASSKIPFAHKIDKNQIKVDARPPGSVPAGTFSRTEDVAGKIAKQTILPQEPVLKDRIIAMDQLKGSPLAAFIPPNKRAVSVRINDVAGVEGFVLPGNQVDVIEVGKGKDSRILLENLKVLAVDQETDKDEPTIVKAVTLEVAPEQVETLLSAASQQEFAIHLALRNPQSARGQPEKYRPNFLTIVRGDKVDIYKVNVYKAR